MPRPGSLLLLALTAACSAVADPESPDGWSRVPGRIDASASSVPLLTLHPQPVRAGETVQLTVSTYGSSSCTRGGDTEVRVRGLRVDVAPFDHAAPPGSPCTRDLQRFPHEVSLRFPRAGDAVVRVHGQNAAGAPLTVPVEVAVLP